MLTGFVAGLWLITLSELGDKTFFIALCLAMQHSRRWVLLGAVLALAAMTILSVGLGQFAAFLPKQWIHHGVIILFVFFGIKLLYDAFRMGKNQTSDAEKEAVETIAASTHPQKTHRKRSTAWAVVVEAFTLTFLAEWGDRTQIATISLAAAHHPLGVTLGAIVGHTFCALLAVFGGSLIAGRLSERVITGVGGLLFLIFAIVTVFEGAQ
ncbi:MAG: TMEM165/GDT1 family protein [Synechococcales bacterium]|nr:TMEM165/GDT1 family protein [Synechococcales bacterium]